MKYSSAFPDALVLGLFETGLAVIRSLGRKNLSVYGVDPSILCGWHSRFVHPFRCPSPQNSEPELIDFLLSLAKRAPAPPVLFVTADSFLHAISRNREALEESCLLNLPRLELLEKITDKMAFHSAAREAGIAAPATKQIIGGADVREVSTELRFPVIVKGRDVILWRAALGPTNKGFIVSDKAGLLETAAVPALKGLPLIVQELVPGPDTNHWKFCCYISSAGEMLCSFTLRKIRQQPIHAGIGSCVESRLNEEVMALGRKLFLALGYRGVGSVEFKQDAETGEFKVIELNPRYWQQNGLADACGQDFAYTQYLDLRGFRPKPKEHFREGVRWVNVHRDWESYQSYSKQGELGFFDWLNSLRFPLLVSDFAWDDPLPFLASFDLRRRALRVAAKEILLVRSALKHLRQQPIPASLTERESGT